MRGAAPSIVCPRCEQEAPPQDGIAKLATCRACGLVFDAAPRDRQVPLRRRRPESEPEPEAPEPEPEDKPAKRRSPTRLQIAAMVALLAGTVLLIQCPGSSEKRGYEKRSDRSFEIAVTRLRLAESFGAYGPAACTELGELLRSVPCRNPASELILLGMLESSLKRFDFGPDHSGRPRRCHTALVETESLLQQLRCVHR